MRFRFAYTGIRVRDFNRSIRFYAGVLGMRVLRQGDDPDNCGSWAVLESEDSVQTLEINWYADHSPVAGPYPPGEGEELDHLAFGVDDFEGAVAHLALHGFPIVLDLSDDRYRQAFIRDPDGIWVELYKPRSEGPG